MASRPPITIDGLKEARRDLGRIDKSLRREADRGLKAAASRTVLPEAREQAPVLTGRLRRSLRVSVSGRGVSIRSRLPYAAAVHWGRQRGPDVAANPFIARAADREADRLIEEVGDELDRFFGRHGFR